MTQPTELEPAPRSPLQTRPIGATELVPTVLTLGSWGLADGAYGPRDRTELEARVREALDLGVRSFDVAPLWGDGMAEEVIGAAIKELRSECTIITRCGAVRKDGELVRALDPESILESVDESRRRLGVEMVDAVLLHDPPEKLLLGGSYAKTFAALKESGAIREWGISTASAESARLALTFGAKVICVPYNLLQPDILPSLLDDIEAYGAGVLVRSPLMHGLLSAEGCAAQSFSDEDHRSRRWEGPALAIRQKQAEGFSAIWSQHASSLAEFALRWSLTSSVVASAIIGPRTKAQLVDLVAAITPVDHLEPSVHARAAQVAAALGV